MEGEEERGPCRRSCLLARLSQDARLLLSFKGDERGGIGCETLCSPLAWQDAPLDDAAGVQELDAGWQRYEDGVVHRDSECAH